MNKNNLTCKARSLRYLKNHANKWIASGTMQRLAVVNSTFTPRTVVRELQRLAEAGEIEVQLQKGHAFYMFSDTKTMTSEQRRIESIRYFDNMPV